MLRSRLFLAICIVAAAAVLVSLGFWQVARLQWKENLIATVEARRQSAPRPLDELLARWRDSRDVDYWPVAATGTFDHAREAYLYTTWRGAVGWYVYAPLRLRDGGWLVVNRGFVPAALRNPAERGQGEVTGELEITGLARNPLDTRPNAFVPDNEPARREFYWKSLAQMTSAMELEGEIVPFFVDLKTPPAPGGYPQAGTTLVDFPNNHLQYALTWFGLAAACLGVGGWFLLAGARRPPANGGRA